MKNSAELFAFLRSRYPEVRNVWVNMDENNKLISMEAGSFKWAIRVFPVSSYQGEKYQLEYGDDLLFRTRSQWVLGSMEDAQEIMCLIIGDMHRQHYEPEETCCRRLVIPSKRFVFGVILLLILGKLVYKLKPH